MHQVEGDEVGIVIDRDAHVLLFRGHRHLQRNEERIHELAAIDHAGREPLDAQFPQAFSIDGRNEEVVIVLQVVKRPRLQLPRENAPADGLRRGTRSRDR